MNQHWAKHSFVITVELLVVCALMVLVATDSRAQESDATKRVLVLYWDTKDYPGNVAFDHAFQAALREGPVRNVEIYPEYLDSNRFPGEHQNELLYNYLLRKYADRKIHVVVALADPPLNFLLKARSNLFTNCPIVFVGVRRPSTEAIEAAPGITGLIQASTQKATLDLALKLHPNTQHVFVISGTPERDKRFEATSREELAGYESTLDITYLTDVPILELMEKTRTLPERSIILYVWQRSGTETETALETYDVLSLIAQSSSAPIYGMGSRNVGYGLVGGYVQGSETNGTKVAEIVQRILTGTRAKDIAIERAPAVPTFDWRQLRRWRIDEHSLPPGSVVRYREMTFWEQYKWRIIGVAALFALQTLLIAVLLIERAGRRRAKKALDQLNAELEQRIQARTAALDAKSRELETFAYSVAHDLKAPLRGIDGYSRLLIEDYGKDLDAEGRNFLLNVQSSATEMSQLIDDLLSYSRLERRELKSDRLELGPIVTSVVEEKKREVSPQVIDFVIDINGGTVLADSYGLVQALRNYMDNAIKFTRNVKRPRIEIGSTETQDKCVLWVRDNGIGFDMKYQSRIFEIFQRLNVSEEYPGTGVGLAIVRKAMERMKGRAWAQSTPGEGATFYLEIPKSNGEQHSQPDSGS